MKKTKRSRSLFRAILWPLFLVLAAEMLILTLLMPIGGMGDRITNNYQNVINLQTANQRDYLESYMVGSWSELSALTGNITRKVQEMVDEGSVTVDGLDSNSEHYTALLSEISDDLISAIYARKINGAYVILNTENLDAAKGEVQKPCLYIRDLDPTSAQSVRNEDLLLERAPLGTLDQVAISTDSCWQPMLSFEDREKQAFFYEPFQKAYGDKERSTVGYHYGYWTSEPYKLQGSERSSISYSEPLILEDGTVVGVVGVELLTGYISSLLPAGELLASNQSAYLLMHAEGESLASLTTVVNSGSYFLHNDTGTAAEFLPLQIGGFSMMDGGSEYYADVQKLNLYRNDSPFAEQNWYIVGIVGMAEMFSFANEMTHILVLALALTLAVGLVATVTVSFRLAKPISQLSSEVAAAQNEHNNDPVFTDTGVEEIDRLSDAFKQLNREIVDTSTKFLSIMDMASVELAGYEWREDSDSVYVTDNFFSMLGMERVNVENISVAQFRELVEGMKDLLGATIAPDGARIYRIVRGDAVRYVRAESTDDGVRHVGLLEDVTRSMLERIRVEHERDYDVLTGLYNRRAFYRKVGHAFSNAADLRYAALVMMDLDNLKMLNDRFGHDWGDKYLRQTAQCLTENTPQNAICARISGDEFYVLFRGYDDKNLLRETVNRMMNAIRETTMHLPDGDTMRLSVSAGVSWYPENSASLQELIKYADFAMYQAKGAQKGTMQEFDVNIYDRDSHLLQGRGDLHEVIEQEKVKYHFQPIYSAATARPAAYEALMRVNMPSIKSPDVLIRIASAQGRLHHIERITMFKATEAFQQLLQNGQVSKDAKLFLNSLSNQRLTDDEAALYHERFAQLQPQIVMEITEGEYLDMDALEAKRNYVGTSGVFALDDYGSGYNGEKNLLLLQPKYIKVDVVFVRGIDTNLDRQQLVASLVAYAHGRDMLVVAEGIETAAELKKVLELGVDLLQGYFLARPDAVPGAIAPEAEEIIEKHRRSLEDATE